MTKESEPMQQLEARRESLSKGIGRIRDIYLSDPIRIGKVEIGSSFSATLEVGRTKSAAKKAIEGLGNRLAQVNNELSVNDEARTYLNRVNQMEHGLAEMKVLMAEGNLPEEILKKHQQEFEELQKFPETNPFLQKAVERIRQEEAKRKEVSLKVEVGEEKVDEKKELEPGMFRLPDRKIVQVSETEQKFLSLIPLDKNVAIPNSELVKKLYSDEFERGEIDLQMALPRANTFRYALNANRLNPVGWKIKNAEPIGRKKGEKGGTEAKLYLAPAEESKKTPPEPSPITEIGETPIMQPPEQTGREKNLVVSPQKQVSPEPYRTITYVDRRTILRGETDHIFRSIVGSVPNELLDDIVELLEEKSDVVRQELADVARMVVAYREGQITPPTPSDFLNARRNEEQQLDYAKITLRSILA